MFDKLQDVETKYVRLTERLSDPSLKPQEMQDLAREEASLRILVDTYRSYSQKKKQFEDSKALLDNESDATLREMAKEDMLVLEADIERLEGELKFLLLPKDPNDDKNIYLEIRAGTGGDEAGLFVADLFRMYTRYAETRGLRVEMMSSSPTGVGGFKEVICLVSGHGAYSRLKYESGVHRVQRVPSTEASGRIHTSAVTVAVMPEVDDVQIDIKDHELRVDVYRSGGKGGQSVNTTDSAVRLTHLPSGLVVICQDEKSQHKNKAKAMKVLRARLFDQKQREQDEANASVRKEQVGSGDRSEKIRTYNFPQSRVTDHRIGLTLHQLDEVINGKLDMIIDPLTAHFQAESLKGPTLSQSSKAGQAEMLKEGSNV